MKISGTFDVKLEPLDAATAGENGIAFGRMSIDKTYQGALEGRSRGEMLTVMTQVQGSAGYVAAEQVTGSLSGKRGSFVLQHYGNMKGGGEFLMLQVVPDSATGELVGLTGKMDIRIEDGQHFYDFDYNLPD
ncbi:DUF3224 domain-containing protein [Nitratireductor sp. XY-223]|uniref:DUF3224 domain-containing protein n=1 Tax=Nitratireductor sp. XY-223 TaxID=2561926 RepID=UPI0010A9BC75|nr:DUF3224 domain-containing protein [Nitratireductor sp. XY-223]